MKKYEIVTSIFNAFFYYTVEAHNEQEAVEKVIDLSKDKVCCKIEQVIELS